MILTRQLRRRLLLTLAGSVFLLPLLGWLLLPLVPMPPALFAPPSAGLELLDREGRSLRLVRQGEAPFQQRASYAEFPPALIHATLAAEDARFWSHPGLDWRGILRAAGQLVRHQRIVSGGSTTTQQLIKQTAPRARTFGAKAVEALRALRLEQTWDKQRILGEYLNRVNYGNFNLGAPAAARFYFGKNVGELSPAECALLAALPQSPTRLNPLRQPERAGKRQHWILAQMLRRGWLTETEYTRAIQEPLRLVGQRQFAAPHFVEFVLETVGQASRLSLASPESSPLLGDEGDRRDACPTLGRVRTTLDLPLNQFAERILRQHLDGLQSKHVGDGSVVVLDNRTGGVLAMVGSADFFGAEAGQVNGAWAPRSAGSTFKPFTYALALERGATAVTVVADVPVSFATPTGVFSPVNYDRHCRGPVSFRQALACSLNIPAVRVLDSLGGPAPLLERLRDYGLTTLTAAPEHYGLGLTIGNAEARLLELANAYAGLARLGEFRPWRVLAEGHPPSSILHPPPLCQPAVAWLIADILSDNAARAGAFGLESALRFDFPVACKTGTSTGFRDNWAFGYTPEFTVGVWVGNFDGSPMQDISGVTGAAPILHELFEHLHRCFGTSWYPAPAGLVEIEVNRLTGKQMAQRTEEPVGQASLLSLTSSESGLPRSVPTFGTGNSLGTRGCESGDRRDAYPTLLAASSGMRPGLDGSGARFVAREKFIPPALPDMETAADYDESGRVRLPTDYADWFATGDNPFRAVAVVEPALASVRITFPLPGAAFFLDGDLPDLGCRITLVAQGGRELAWSSPTLAIQSVGPRHVAALRPGRHELTVRDSASGKSASTWVTVKEP